MVPGERRAALQHVEKLPDGRVRVHVIVSGDDGFTRHAVEVAAGPGVVDRVKAAIRAKVQGQDTAAAVLTPGPLDLTPPTDPSPPASDPAAVAREAWLTNYRKLLKAKEAVAAGILPADLPALVTLQSQVIADFLPAYLDHIQ